LIVYPSRPRLSLDGEFRFTFDPHNRGIDEGWFSRSDRPSVRISVPGSWQRLLNAHQPIGWYWKRFSVPPTLKDGLIFLSFGAVDALCEVWVNGQPVGRHAGGYTPFDFEISEVVHRTGSNLLAVRVVDVSAERPTHPEVPEDICRGGQGGHREMSGLWQSVYLEGRPPLYFRDLKLVPELDPPILLTTCKLAVSELYGQEVLLEARLVDSEGKPIAQENCQWQESIGDQIQLSLRPEKDSIVPWSLSQPQLYILEVDAMVGGKRHDHVRARTGFRTIEAERSTVILNGEPIYVRGLLDPGVYPGNAFSPPSLSFLHDEMARYKSQGFNLVRTHRTPFPPCALDACDEIGLLVWQETPLAEGTPWDVVDSNGNRGTTAVREIEDLVRRDHHHPSLIIWGVTSENVQSTTVHGGRWMHEMCNRIREDDPDALIIENSDPFHYGAGTARSDILDFHKYRDVPHCKSLDAGSPEVTPPSISSLNSEFGAWGFPIPDDPKIGSEYGKLFSHLRREFDDLGLRDTFVSAEDFCLESQSQQYDSIKQQVEGFRRNPKVTGYVLNGAYDCCGWCTGLADPLRHPRSFSEKMKDLNADVLPIVEWPTRNFWAKSEIRLTATVVNHSGRSLEDWGVEYRAGRRELILAHGICKGHPIGAGACGKTEEIKIPLPELENMTAFKLIAGWQAGDDDSSETDWIFWAYPPIDTLPSCPVSVNVLGSWPRLWESLPHLEAASLDLCDVLLAQEWDQTVEDSLQEGGSVVLVCDRFERGKVGAQKGTAKPFKTSFVRQNHPIFAEFPRCRRIDARFQALVPSCLMTGVRRPLAGYFREWDYFGAAMAEFQVGTGRLLVTTFCFDQLEEDPMTTHLLHAMIQYAAGERFQPTEPLFL
jgi:hypothetical protein